MLFDRVLLVLSMFSRGSSKNSESSAPGTPMLSRWEPWKLSRPRGFWGFIPEQALGLSGRSSPSLTA
jgi:hypothetical protein